MTQTSRQIFNKLAINGTKSSEALQNYIQLLGGDSDLREGDSDLREGDSDLREGDSDLREGDSDLREGDSDW